MKCKKTHNVENLLTVSVSTCKTNGLFLEPWSKITPNEIRIVFKILRYAVNQDKTQNILHVLWCDEWGMTAIKAGRWVSTSCHSAAHGASVLRSHPYSHPTKAAFTPNRAIWQKRRFSYSLVWGSFVLTVVVQAAAAAREKKWQKSWNRLKLWSNAALRNAVAANPIKWPSSSVRPSHYTTWRHMMLC